MVLGNIWVGCGESLPAEPHSNETGGQGGTIMRFTGWREWDAENHCRGRVVNPNEEYFPCWCTNCYTMFNDVDDLDDDHPLWEYSCPNCEEGEYITFDDDSSV